MLQTINTGVCSRCLGHIGFAPAHGMCAFPVYTAQALCCSAGNCLRLALGCMYVPGPSRSGSGTQVVLRGTDSVGPPIHEFFIGGVNQPWVKNIQGREGVQKVPKSKTLIFHIATSLFSATPHSTWDLCSPTRDCPTPLTLERQSLSHWIASKVPLWQLFIQHYYCITLYCQVL